MPRFIRRRPIDLDVLKQRAFQRRRGGMIEQLERRTLLSAGDLDTTFNGDGKVVADFSPDLIECRALLSSATVTYPLSAMPRLSSLPGAPANLHIDLDGDAARTWGGWNVTPQQAFDLDGDASSFNDSELQAVNEIWSAVADAFSPFNLNVTTVDPGPGANGPGQTLRVVAGGDGTWYPGFAGGIAMTGAFNLQENWVYAFQSSSPRRLAGTIAHEAGHGFYLGHQSGYDSSTGAWEQYRRFTGDVGAIMSASYNPRLLWWNGPSGSSTNIQDDMAVLAGPLNGFGYRADDHGGATGAATTLTLASSPADAGAPAADGAGILHHHTDQDWFAFDWSGGALTVMADGTASAATLDPRLELRSATGSPIATADDDAIGATLTANVPAGSYRIVVASGRHPDGTTQTSYGEAGQYTLRVVGAHVASGQYPFHGAPLWIGAEGPARIEVEDFDRGGEGAAYREIDPYGTHDYRAGSGPDLRLYDGEGYALEPRFTWADEWLEYTVDVAAAGTYDLAFRASAANAGASMRLEVDGVDVSGTVSIPTTSGPDVFRTFRHGGVQMPAGRHVLRLVFENTGQAIGAVNWLELAPVSAAGQAPYAGQPAPVSASSPTTIQLEDFDRGGQGIAYHETTPAQNTGGAYRAAEGVDIKPVAGEAGNYRISDAFAGEWLEYTVAVAAAGTYDLQFRVSSPGAGGRFHAEVNGADVTGGLSVPDTGSFDAFAPVTAAGVQLRAGINVLRVAFDAQAPGSGAAGGFDAVRIAPAAEPAVAVSLIDPVLSRGMDPAVLRFTRTGSTRADLWVRYDVATPDPLYKFRGLHGGVLIPAGATSADLEINAGSYSGPVVDASATITVAPDPFYAVGSPAGGTVTFDADAPPTVWLGRGDTGFAERYADEGTFVLLRGGDHSAPLTVDYRLGGTATAGEDYNGTTTGTATFSAGSNFAVVTLRPVNDLLAEGDETVVLTLQPGSGYAVAEPSASTLVLMDNEAAPPPDDNVYIQGRVVHVDGTAGNDTIHTGGGLFGSEVLDVTLNGVTHRFNAADFDSVLIRGFAGNDSFNDEASYSTLFEGGDGDDFAQTFSDEGAVLASVVGGAGNDTVRFHATSGPLTPFDGGTGRDKIILEPIGTVGDLDLRNFPTVEDAQIQYGILTGNSLNNHLAVTDGSSGQIFGGDGNDTLDGSAEGLIELYGENGDDVLIGTNTSSESYGSTDPTIVDGGAGNDTLISGLGNELLRGGLGTDEVTYASRTAALRITLDDIANDGATGEGDNVFSDVERIRGGAGADWIDGNAAGNILYGLAGNDTLVGFGGNDALFGGSDNDRIYGGSGDDYIEGNGGDDTLQGEAGADNMLGHDGNDVLYAGDADTVLGYDGSDVVNFSSTGPATLAMEGGLAPAYIDTLNVNAGSLAFASDVNTHTANLVINVADDASVTFNSTQHLHALNLADGAVVTMPANGDRFLFTRGLSIADTAKLDLADNDLLWDYTGDSPYLTARGWVATGRGGASGITSSTSTGKTVLALVDNAIYGRNSWNGQEIDETTLIGKYTYYGDSNLDGKVTGDDYVAIDSNLGKTDAQWIHGDFNFDGRTSGDDYVAIDANLGLGTADPASFDELQAEMIAIHAESYGGEEYEKKVAQAERGTTRPDTRGRPAGRSPRR